MKKGWMLKLKEIGKSKAWKQLKPVHAEILRSGMESDTSVSSCLLQMYGRSGSIDLARLVFDSISETDDFTFSMMITAYAGKGYLENARDCFNSILHPNVVCCSAIITAYTRVGRMREAETMFSKLPERDVPSWNNMISAFALHRQMVKALEFFRCIDLEGLIPNAISFLSALDGCGSVSDVESLHNRVAEIELPDEESGVKVANALIHQYGKHLRIDQAAEIFNKMSCKNIISWTSIISAFDRCGMSDQALMAFWRMNLEGEKPNSVTLIAVLQACNNGGAGAQARTIHRMLLDSNHQFLRDPNLSSAILSMYSRTGSMDEAYSMFKTTRSFHNLACFNSMISSLAQSGDSSQALSLAREMRVEGIVPDESTFAAVVTACNHAGMLDEAILLVKVMMVDYGIHPGVEQFVCVSDLLGRGGRLAEAEELINLMPFEADSFAWTSLLQACKAHGDLERADRISGKLRLIKPDQSSAYILLSNAGV